ncbi:MAG: hypothetical protein Q9182_006870 [Xanthomendoza sp. 2 TL-2023]
MAENPSLESKLAAALPKSHRFVIHHLSTPPTASPAIYSAPPGQKQEATTCESHFLSVSINHNDCQIQVFALEILIYATHYLTTLFVSKADSTGYIHLLNLPKKTPSPLKTISSTFIAHLVKGRQRKDRQLVVSLFARAQDQYLFPGSIENPHKHVLDDRGLIKWWCRVLEPVLHVNKTPGSEDLHPNRPNPTASAYLRVPSCDLHETRSFFPPHVRHTPTLHSNWHADRDPLRDLSGRHPTDPERCLIPRFPDDPKSRFVDELDEELTEPHQHPLTTTPTKKTSPSKGPRPGRWKSVRSLAQFWELMAFRQECSSGRLVGFLWAVFHPAPADLHDSPPPTPTPSTKKNPCHPPYPPPLTLPLKHYTRITRLLLALDFSTPDLAAESSGRWIEDVGICTGRPGWGVTVIGEHEERGEGVVKKEKRGAEEEEGGVGAVNMLAMGLVRKKVKVR